MVRLRLSGCVMHYAWVLTKVEIHVCVVSTLLASVLYVTAQGESLLIRRHACVTWRRYRCACPPRLLYVRVANEARRAGVSSNQQSKVYK